MENGRGTDRHIFAVHLVNGCTVGKYCDNQMSTGVDDGQRFGSARIVGLRSGRRGEAAIDVPSCKAEWYGVGIQCCDVVAVLWCVCYVLDVVIVC